MKWFAVTSVIWVLGGSLELLDGGEGRSRDEGLKAATVIPVTIGCVVDQSLKREGAGKCMDSSFFKGGASTLC